jgi:hypothetical protein
MLMADDLSGKTYYAGAAIAGLAWSFTRPAGDTTTNYTGCAIALRVFEQNSKGIPVSNTPVLSLAIGAGLTRSTDSASNQVGKLEITSTQVTTLIGTAVAKRFGYAWSITPVGGQPLRAPLGEGFDGWFAIAQEGYAGAPVVKIPSV